MIGGDIKMTGKTENYGMVKDTFDITDTNHYIIGFLNNWVTLKEAVALGLNYQAESIDGDFHSKTKVTHQDNDKTIISSKLFKNVDGENLLDYEQILTICHKDLLKEIKKEYDADLSFFNHIRNMMVDDYGYQVIEQETVYDEFGFHYDNTENVKFRRIVFIKKYPLSLTVEGINNMVNEEFKYIEQSSKLTDCLYVRKGQYFEYHTQIPCNKIEFVQKIK